MSWHKPRHSIMLSLSPLATMVVVAAVAFSAVRALAGAAEPLHQRIDAAIEAKQPGPVAPLCDDATFLRRVYLTFVGTIPTSDQARAFLNEKSPDKRARLIDQLLASPRYALHMANVFDVMLMERRGDQHVKAPQWRQYLVDSFVQNKPWDQLAREILGADGVDPKLRPAVKFYLDRGAEVNMLTRDVGRVFFGRDLQCAQCHDHPIIDNYLQSEYYGIYAFLNRSFVFTDGKKKQSYFAEKAEGQVSYKSVFKPSVTHRTGPRLPDGAALDEPTFANADAAYKVKPAKNVRPVPTYSRRQRLAKEATSGANRAFNRNIVNRLWAHVMGRGLVHPVDLNHAQNPPTYPQLLETLADQFVAMKYDMKAMLRQLALTRTFQRAYVMPADVTAQIDAAQKQLAALEAEVKRLQPLESKAYDSVLDIDEAVGKACRNREKTAGELSNANKALAAAQKAAAGPVKALAEAQKQMTARQALMSAVTAAATKAQQAVALATDDKALADATAKLKARVAQLEKELAALKKTVADRTKAAKPTSDKVAAAQKSVEQAKAKVADAQKPVDAAQAQYTKAMAERRTHQRDLALVEQQLAVVKALVEFDSASKQVQAAEASVGATSAKLASVNQASNNAEADLESLQKQAASLEAQLKQGRDKLESQRAAADVAFDKLSQQWSKRFAVAPLVSLTPEQMAWSVMQATGVVGPQRAAAEAEVNKKTPLTEELRKDAAKLFARQLQVEQAVDAKVNGNVSRFVSLFAAASGQPQNEFFATVDQALFFANDGLVRGWTNPSGNNLTARLSKLNDTKALADELYLSVLTRRPSETEINDVASYISGRDKDRAAAIGEIVWALLTSNEFRFRH